MVRPSRRGGVPVFSRPTAKPKRTSVAPRPYGRRVAGAATLDLELAVVQSPPRKVPVVRMTARARNASPRLL
jgi:hypothetical protein